MLEGSIATGGGPEKNDPAPATWTPSYPPTRARWDLGSRTLDVGAPRIMGVVNLTPDSFSDGGELETLEAALAHAEALVRAGADLIDVGGESTRPGATEVPAAEELRRILPFLREAPRRLSVPLSVDTRKVEVARAAVEEGATVVNDVSGLSHDPGMASFVAEAGVGVVVMHMRGSPESMRSLARYHDVIGDVERELSLRVAVARETGIPDERIVLDPGIGFAKTADHSYRLIRDVHRIVEMGFPVLVGPSRKSFLDEVLDAGPGERLEGTIAACAWAYRSGARLFRVHDVAAVSRALNVSRRLLTCGAGIISAGPLSEPPGARPAGGGEPTPGTDP